MPEQPPQNPAQDDDPTRHLSGPPAPTGETGARPAYGRGAPPPQGFPAYGPGPAYGPAQGAPPLTGPVPSGPVPSGPVPSGPVPGYGPYGPPPGGYGAVPPPGRMPGPAYGRVDGVATGAQPTQAFGGSSAGPPGGTTQAAATVTAAEKPKGDLNVTKVLAGAGAAAASAVAGSFFGAMGTVSGAAVGAVFSSVVTEAMQRSLDKTRDTVKARIKLPGGRTVDVEGKTEVPAPPVSPGGESGQARVYVTPGDRPTEVIPAVSATGDAPTVATASGAASAKQPRSRRRLLVMAGFTVVIFAMGLLAITGIELVKGSPLNTSSSTSQRSSGTSLGSVLGGSGAAATETSTSKPTATETDESDEDEESARSTAEEDEDSEPSAERGRSGESASATPSRTTRATPTPTPDADSGGGAAPNAQSGGGAGSLPEQE